MKNENDFELEGELHMNLNIFHDFQKIHNLKDNNFTFKKNNQISLKGFIQ